MLTPFISRLNPRYIHWNVFLGLDDSSLDTSTLSNGSRTPTRRSAADGVRKRLMLSASYVSSDPEDSPCPKVNSHKM